MGMLTTALMAWATLWPSPVQACPRCAPLVHALALGPGFGSTLLLLLLPLVLIALLGAAAHGRPPPP